jgi:mannitol/fructose-specific phosphotransferase system IIA component (Ntr-type)
MLKDQKLFLQIQRARRSYEGMKITNFITKDTIVYELSSKEKKDVIKELIQVIKYAHRAERFSVGEAMEVIMQREKLGSTGLGGGVAVPHAKLERISQVLGAFGRSSRGIEFDALDGEPVYLVFLILTPAKSSGSYLWALQKIMQAIKQPNFCKFLRNAKNVKEIFEIFKETEDILDGKTGQDHK